MALGTQRGHVPAQGGPTLGASYTHDDVDVIPGTTYAYMLEDVDVYGQATMHGPVSVEVGEMPTAIEVHAFGASGVSRTFFCTNKKETGANHPVSFCSLQAFFAYILVAVCSPQEIRDMFEEMWEAEQADLEITSTS